MFAVTNPATGDLLDRIEEDTPASIAEKFTRARAEQKGWARRPIEERLVAIRRFGSLLHERRNSLAKTLTLEVGKPITQSLNELDGMQPRIDFFLRNTARVIAEERVHDDPEEIIVHEPLGVIANISAWNYPYFVGSNVFLPALLTGNGVLYKPSEFASLTGRAISDLLHEAGIPADLFIAVLGDGRVGAELIKQPVDGIFFTGSSATGRKIAEASRMVKTQLELGGKDPVYVCDDVDARGAAEATAGGAFYNTGQSCCAVERLYVHRRVFDPFVEAFVNTVRGFVVGDPLDPKTFIGPLTRDSQRSVLERQIADATAKGAKILCGGKPLARPGFFFDPTVLVDVNSTMEVMRAETFGPLIAIQGVSSDDEAVALMNDTEYGLTAGVYSRDRDRAARILDRVNVGTVYWNCCDRVSPRLPWSGRGRSGIGLTLSTYGIQAFVRPKAWHLRKP
jgi:acyl-CoA reductase-like NAD-dependent aldehyde dehydrogenase